MEKTIVAVSTHRGLSPETEKSLKGLGCPAIMVRGVSDTAMARNVALTRGLAVAVEQKKETLLMVDDDMVFDPRAAHELVKYSRELERPVSGLYSTQDAQAAATLAEDLQGSRVGPRWANKAWLTGLGFLAIPVSMLERLAANSQLVDVQGKDYTIFTWSGLHGDRYYPEDYTLCHRLGGALLSPFPAGHMKTVPLWPDRESIEKVESGDYAGVK